MNILLIGHEGYLGRGLFAYFSKRHKVVGWDKKEDLFTLDSSLLAAEKIDLLINMSVAADRQGKTFDVDSPSDTVNVMGARHLAKILKGSEIMWIQMSTREVFGPVYGSDDVVNTNAGYRPKKLLKEDCPYAPVNPYGKSKIMGEFIAESHPFSNVIRLTTCYTDYEDVNRGWMFSLIQKASQGLPVSLSQGGRQFRDPLHVDDLGRLMELLHEKRVYGQKINAGGGEQNLISLREFVEIAKPGIQIEEAPGGDFGIAFDISKARDLTGWEPRTLVRERIPVIAKNIQLGISKPEI